MNYMSKSLNNSTALNLLGFEEIASTKMFVFVSLQNRKALDILRTLHSYINQESRMNTLVNSVLSSDKIDESIPLSVPVVWLESDMLENNTVNHKSFIPDYINQQEGRVIAEKAGNFCTNASQAMWNITSKAEKESLDKELNILAESFFADSNDEKNQRIYKTILSLWQNSNLNSLGRGA